MTYYKIVFKNGYSTIIETSEPIDFRLMTYGEPFVFGDAYINNVSDIIIIEKIKPLEKAVVEDCEHCRYEGTPYCLDCINHELFASKN